MKRGLGIEIQTQAIFAHLQGGPITSLDALNLYGCFRLAARIYDLRQEGHYIITNRIETGNGKSIAEYILLRQASATHP